MSLNAKSAERDRASVQKEEAQVAKVREEFEYAIGRQTIVASLTLDEKDRLVLDKGVPRTFQNGKFVPFDVNLYETDWLLHDIIQATHFAPEMLDVRGAWKPIGCFKGRNAANFRAFFKWDS